MSDQEHEVFHTRAEDIANALTSGLGACFGIAGLVVLIAMSAGNAWQVTGVAIFGAALVLSYGVSAAYHGAPASGIKRVLRRLDHAAIFLLIAGTYTPFLLVNLRGPLGWTLFGIVWAVAVGGIVLKCTRLRHGEHASLLLYLGLGWLGVIAIKPLAEALDPGGLALLLAGGIAYTVGVIFYLWRSLPYRHAVWHLFVLGGSFCHFFAVTRAIAPVG